MSFLRLHGIAAFATWLILLASPLPAQQTTPASAQPAWWFGGYLGANYNLFSGELHDLADQVTNVADDGGFVSGSGIGLTLGGAVRYVPGGMLGGTLQVGYDNRSVELEDVVSTSHSLSRPSWTSSGALSLSYLSIEPNLRIELPGFPIHFLAGPGVAVNLARSYAFAVDEEMFNDFDTTGELADVRSLVLGGQLGFGYDLLVRDLLGADAIFTPMLQMRFGQSPIDPPEASRNDIAITSVRFGLQVSFASADVFARQDQMPEGGEFDYALRVPRHITHTRRVNETFPLRADLFFDEGSTEIPARYARLTPEQARNFREEQLTEPASMTGGVRLVGRRERRQMLVYYEALNVVGDRMRNNATAKIRLVGAANGNAGRGLEMARSVRDYLVGTFGIASDRIDVEGQPQPSSRSGTGSSARGESASMIAAENVRVTIVGPDEILRPVRIITMQEEPLDNDVIVTVPVDSSVVFWTMAVDGPDGAGQSFGPFKGSVGRVPGKQLLEGRDAAEFTGRIVATTADGDTRTSAPRGFHLQRAADDEVQTGERYSILFEFDDSKTVQTYERFLVETVAPAIPHAAVVVVHGHTDLIGDEDYNARLSHKRAEETQRVLSRELQKRGAFVTFDTYGFGEDERRAPFDNAAPEHRYYNRTVVIEVVQGE